VGASVGHYTGKKEAVGIGVGHLQRNFLLWVPPLDIKKKQKS
jgi:hypothetical protein